MNTNKEKEKEKLTQERILSSSFRRPTRTFFQLFNSERTPEQILNFWLSLRYAQAFHSIQVSESLQNKKKEDAIRIKNIYQDTFITLHRKNINTALSQWRKFDLNPVVQATHAKSFLYLKPFLYAIGFSKEKLESNLSPSNLLLLDKVYLSFNPKSKVFCCHLNTEKYFNKVFRFKLSRLYRSKPHLVLEELSRKILLKKAVPYTDQRVICCYQGNLGDFFGKRSAFKAVIKKFSTEERQTRKKKGTTNV